MIILAFRIHGLFPELNMLFFEIIERLHGFCIGSFNDNKSRFQN
jgi:hypothetical protein